MRGIYDWGTFWRGIYHWEFKDDPIIEKTIERTEDHRNPIERTLSLRNIQKTQSLRNLKRTISLRTVRSFRTLNDFCTIKTYFGLLIWYMIEWVMGKNFHIRILALEGLVFTPHLEALMLQCNSWMPYNSH